MNPSNQENTLRFDYKPVLMAAKKRNPSWRIDGLIKDCRLEYPQEGYEDMNLKCYKNNHNQRMSRHNKHINKNGHQVNSDGCFVGG